MIVVMRTGYAPRELDEVCGHLEELGYQVNPIVGAEKTILAAVGGGEHVKYDALDQIRAHDGVEDVIFITKPYKIVAREYRKGLTAVDVSGVSVGGDEVIMMAGPCTVESAEQLETAAAAVARSGARILRGGAYKPSTSPYSFQGMGAEGLRLLRECADRHGLRVVTEVMDVRKVELVAEYADLLQVGTRNMQNYDLLKEVGLAKRPVLLKRGMSARIEEWLLAAEYVASSGNENIILCERGVRTFETSTRNTLDLSAVPALKSLTHLPVIVDPSQGTGKRDLVPPMCRAAIAAGADGLIVETHPNPDHAIKDGAQSMTLEAFAEMMPSLARVAEAVERCMRGTPEAIA
jgi:3-deoxy-7-phosphoheptulonate synthase